MTSECGTDEDILTFNILPLYGDSRKIDRNKFFGVVMARDKQVDFLRPLIRERLSPNTYYNVPSNELFLFKLNDQVTTKNIDYYLSSNNLNVDKMEPLELISKYFPKDEFGSKEHIHIIMRKNLHNFVRSSENYGVEEVMLNLVLSKNLRPGIGH
ncbi:18123_t:CDS:2 [Rhizophagus irregularis]|nr:18123_t:CDS:2 [Rhizophagus irregularis]